MKYKLTKEAWIGIGKQAGWMTGLELKDSYGKIPDRMLRSLNMYVKNGVPPGDFLMAVLNHDLFEAVGRADTENQEALADYVKYIYNYCPGGCHGSRERIREWINDGGAEGKDSPKEEEPENPYSPDVSM